MSKYVVQINSNLHTFIHLFQLSRNMEWTMETIKVEMSSVCDRLYNHQNGFVHHGEIFPHAENCARKFFGVISPEAVIVEAEAVEESAKVEEEVKEVETVVEETPVVDA